MRRRNPLFVTVLILTVAVLTAPYLAAGAYIGWMSYEFGGFAGQLPFDLIGLTGTSFEGSRFGTTTMVRDRIYWTTWESLDDENNRFMLIVHSSDPETGDGIAKPTEDSMTAEAHLTNEQQMSIDQFRVVGDSNQLWITGSEQPGMLLEFDGKEFVERNPRRPDGMAKPDPESQMAFGSIPMAAGLVLGAPTFAAPFVGHMNVGQALSSNGPFLQDGRLTIVVESSEDGRRAVIQLVGDQWQSLGEISLLDTTRGWTNADGRTLFDPVPEIVSLPSNLKYKYSSTMATINTSVSITAGAVFTPPGMTSKPNPGELRLLPTGSTCHLFWQVSNRLLYRNELKLAPKQEPITAVDANGDRPRDPASALEPTNVPGVSDDWSFVMEIGGGWMPVLVGGEPAVLSIESKNSESTGFPVTTVAKVFRQDGERWKEFASTELPYGSQSYFAGSRDDRSISYLGATSILGRTQVFAIEPTGMRQTQFDDAPIPSGLYDYICVPILLGWSLFAGLVLAVVATFLMRRDPVRFEFGHQSVELASAFERGLARLIDLTFLLALTAGLFGGLTLARKFDWWTALEALNLGDLRHASVTPIAETLSVSAVVLALAMLALIVLQGWFSVTPGKWLCRLRTVRTTLKPCGFARSLVREVLLCVDSLNLLSWTPGILSIAFTENRQRLGDLVADTIVIRSRKRNH